MEIIKRHPYISIGALLATVAVVFYSASGGSSDTGTSLSTVDPNAVAAGTALQQSQMQQQTALTGIAASLQAKESDNATAVMLADLQGKYGYDVAQLNAGVQLSAISAQAQTIQLQSTLEAQSTQAAVKATTDQAAINANASIINNQTVANVLVSAANSQAQVAIANINAAKEVATSCHGLGCLF